MKIRVRQNPYFGIFYAVLLYQFVPVNLFWHILRRVTSPVNLSWHISRSVALPVNLFWHILRSVTLPVKYQLLYQGVEIVSDIKFSGF